MENNKVSYSVKVEEAVLKLDVSAEVDIIDVLADLAKRTSNTIDDKLVKLVELARGNMDWEGYAKEHILIK